MAIFPDCFPSIRVTSVVIVDSRSEAEMVRLPFSTMKRKLSRMGSGLLEFKTPEICCNCFRSVLLDTMNFIGSEGNKRRTTVAFDPQTYHIPRKI